MQVPVYRVISKENGTLGIMPRPRGGELLAEELLALRDMGIQTVVSLLTASEQWELELTREQELCELCGMQFLSFPIEDRKLPPGMQQFLQFIRSLSDRYDAGERIVVHCRAGIGRAALVAAGVMVLRGIGVNEAFDRISKVRGCPVPDTDEQRQWLVEFTQRYREMERVERLFDGKDLTK